MSRLFFVPLFAVILLGTTFRDASAGMFQFIPGTIPDGENQLTVIGDGKFELSDTPSPAPNDFQFPVISPFDVQVTGSDGAGGAMPIVFSLLRASTTTGRVNLIFGNNQFSNLLLYFDVPGLERGQPIPDSVLDSDGIVSWNAPGVVQSRPSGGILAGTFNGGSLIKVPEPAGMLSVGAAIFLIAVRSKQGRRQVAARRG